MSLLPGSLVSTEWLEEHLLEPSVRVVDIRGYVKTVDAGTGDGKQQSTYVGARDEYDAAHIPGAVYAGPAGQPEGLPVLKYSRLKSPAISRALFSEISPDVLSMW